MGEIILKIRRKRRKVTIIRDEERLNREIANINDYYQRVTGTKPHPTHKPESEQSEEEKKSIKKSKRTIFTQTFTISNSNQPIQINLDKIPEEQIGIEEAKIEVQNAYDKGFTDGQEASNAAYQNEINTYKNWIKNIDSVVRNLRSDYVRELAKLENAVTELSIMIASHIIDREAVADSNVVIKQVRKAIAKLDDEEIFKILVNPDDFEILQSAKSDLISDKSRIEKVVISPDRSIEHGGCILITSAGTINATIATQLDKLYDELLDVVEQSSSPETNIMESPEEPYEPGIIYSEED